MMGSAEEKAEAWTYVKDLLSPQEPGPGTKALFDSIPPAEDPVKHFIYATHNVVTFHRNPDCTLQMDEVGGYDFEFGKKIWIRKMDVWRLRSAEAVNRAVEITTFNLSNQ